MNSKTNPHNHCDCPTCQTEDCPAGGEPDTYAVAQAMIMHGGGFTQALGEAILLADSHNLRRIKAAFPDYWDIYSIHLRRGDTP